MDNNLPITDENSEKTPSSISQNIEVSKVANITITDTVAVVKDEAIIHEMVESHRKELENVVTQLAKEARKRTRFSSSIKVTVIFLGAFVAIKEVANQLIGSSNIWNIVIFTIAGLLIAVLTGLEAAFRWENTAAELKSLVATGRAASRNAASDLAKAYAARQGRERLKELKRVLDVLDHEIVNIQKHSAAIGIETITQNNIFKNQALKVSITGKSDEPLIREFRQISGE